MKQFITLLLFFGFVTKAHAEKILVIGDSISCTAFGAELVDALTKKNHEVTLLCAISSKAEHWVKGQKPSGQICHTRSVEKKTFIPCEPKGQMPIFTALLEKHKDSKVIVALGTNSLQGTQADSYYRQMAEALKNNDCEWISPPHLNPMEAKGFSPALLTKMEKNLDPFYASLEASVSPFCKLIDSRPMTRPGTMGNKTKDGMHANEVGAAHWVKEILKQTHPIRTQPALSKPANK
ncbi:MAG: SGNH/GDSL hydrolase family protein [Bdellovibrionales bacterium]